MNEHLHFFNPKGSTECVECGEKFDVPIKPMVPNKLVYYSREQIVSALLDIGWTMEPINRFLSRVGNEGTN